MLLIRCGTFQHVSRRDPKKYCIQINAFYQLQTEVRNKKCNSKLHFTYRNTTQSFCLNQQSFCLNVRCDYNHLIYDRNYVNIRCAESTQIL